MIHGWNTPKGRYKNGGKVKISPSGLGLELNLGFDRYFYFEYLRERRRCEACCSQLFPVYLLGTFLEVHHAPIFL